MRRLRPLFALSFALALPAWAAPPEASGEDLLGRTVFQVLIGELALREGAVDLSLQAWVDLAQRTRDPKVIALAAEIASYAGNNALALQLVRQWQAIEPDSVEQYDEFSAQNGGFGLLHGDEFMKTLIGIENEK